jgi:hypothetical protein
VVDRRDMWRTETGVEVELTQNPLSQSLRLRLRDPGPHQPWTELSDERGGPGLTYAELTQTGPEKVQQVAECMVRLRMWRFGVKEPPPAQDRWLRPGRGGVFVPT